MNIERMKSLLVDFCGIPSISETHGETEMARMIFDKISEIQYFKDNPANAAIDPIDNDPLGRSYVHALMEGKGKSPKTVVLLSHYDVVDVVDYGPYKDYAFKPMEYTELLKQDDSISLTDDARADLHSGDYLFGRGTMDMKYGLAVDVEILYQVEKIIEYFPGNILLLSVPDEENNSVGMLAADELLRTLKKERKLEYTCCIVSEPYFPKYPGDDSKYIYTGAIGKLLPVFFCVGRETHVGDPFSGFNPNLLTAKLIEHIELNPELCDFRGSSRVPAPVCLKQSDTKSTYSVQTPTSAYTYFNYMTLTSSPEEVLEKLRTIALKAFEEVIGNVESKARQLKELTGGIPRLPNSKPMVLTFRELYEMCLDARGKDFRLYMDSYMKNAPEADFRHVSLDIVREVHKFCPYRDPMIVLFFAPPYYPHSEIVKDNSIIARVVSKIVSTAEKEYNERFTVESFFPGLSDMSYLSLPQNIDTASLKANFPLWGDRYNIPLDTISELDIPFLNLGPMGKDAHKYTERLNLPYSFGPAARLIYQTVLWALENYD
ncbi:MAG TPA: M20/M25/M40 family metallo-hydrolase [Clostridia bacterium]|nr:M20/M25/M40 family metallo-hydrolase [Clostridia bacterium]